MDQNTQNNDILSLITTLANQASPAVPQFNLPTLNYTPPTDLPAKFQEFLRVASQQPDIINYYNQLLDAAKGDLNTAIGFLENDYKTGVRQVTDTLGNTLEQLGLKNVVEQEQLQDTLNQRGIATTDIGNDRTAYAAGGRPATELGRLNMSQRLRQEAERRTAQQSIENKGITRSKGISSAQIGTRDKVLGYGQQKQQDITGRANINFNNYLNEEQNKANQALQNQSNEIAMGGSSSSGNAERSHINPHTGLWDDNWKAGTWRG